MSQHAPRSRRTSWRARERKLRASYRGKIAIAVIISLIVGMIGGIVVDKLVLTKPADTTVVNAADSNVSSDTETGMPDLFGNKTEDTEDTESDMPNLFGNTDVEEEPAAEATQAPITEAPVTEAPATEEPIEENTEVEAESNNAEVSEAVWTDVNSDATEEPVAEEPVAEEPATEEPATEETETAAAEVEVSPTLMIGTSPETEESVEEPAATEEATEGDAFGSLVEAVENTENTAEEPAATEVAAETEVPTEVPTEEPTPEPTPAPPAATIVSYGSECTLTTDINPDGSAHMVDDGTEFENVSLTLQVKKYLDFDYYDRTYGSKYNLKGGTAAVVLGITLNGYTGSAPIVPQNFLLITFCNETGDVTTQGVQIIDAEISGNTGVAITSDVPATVYKRYYKEEAGGEMTYMVVTTYNKGVKEDYWFEIIIPADMVTPEPTADPNLAALTVGSRGDDVVKLQTALIDAGYLTGKADGIFGNNTAEGVKQMQKQFGMEETGEADPLFLTYLYMDTE